MVLSKQNLLIEVKCPGNTLLKDQGLFLNRETKIEIIIIALHDKQ